jgi:hypothetical protein
MASEEKRVEFIDQLLVLLVNFGMADDKFFRPLECHFVFPGLGSGFFIMNGLI